MKLSFKQESGDWQMYVDSKKVLLAPFPGSQDAFVRDTSYEVLYSGPRAVGKTLALLMAYWQHVGRGFGRDWKGVILRPTVPELKEIEALSLKYTQRLFPGALYNILSHTWTFPGGESLVFAPFAVPADFARFHGHAYSFIGWEELSLWPTDECYRAMMAVHRSTNPRVPKLLRSTTNPHGVGFQWLRERFMPDSVPDGQTVGPAIQIPNLSGEPSGLVRRLIRGYAGENVLMQITDPLYRQRLLDATEGDKAKRAAWLEGSWLEPSGSLLGDAWEESKQFAQVPNFEIPDGDYLSMTFDMGTAAPWATLYFWQAHGERLYFHKGSRLDFMDTIPGDIFIHSEIYGWSGKSNSGCYATPNEIAKRILAYERNQGWLVTGTRPRVRYRVADDSIFPGRSNPHIGASTAADLERAGIVFPEEYRVKKDPGTRIEGYRQIRQGFMAAIPKGGRREFPGLFIADQCTHVLRTVPSLPRDPNNFDDSDPRAEDHLADCVRYRLLADLGPRVSFRRRTI